MQFDQLKRREFITLLGAAAAAWPLAARAQQGERLRRVGVLMGSAEKEPLGQARIAAFRQGLQALGWTEGRNLQIEYRWAGADIDRMRAYAAEMVRLAPQLIVVNSTPFIDAVHKATRTIPVVFVLTIDPVGSGFIESMARPGGNMTGFTFMEMSLIGKWAAMLKECAPSMKRVGLLFNPDTTPYYLPYLRSIEAAPGSLPVELKGLPVRDPAEIEPTISAFAHQDGGSLISPAGPFNIVHGGSIARLALRFRLPAISLYRQFVVDGGLMAYAPDSTDIFRRSASYVDRILKGERPSDLPAQAATKFEFALNLRTAKALSLDLPPSLLALADEVIE
jgi:putative ABC transport system substrate-binding protein